MRVLEPSTKCDRSNDTKKSAGCFRAIFARRRRPNTTKRPPEQETQIIIWYDEKQEDFEATLQTYKTFEKNGDIVYRHFLVNVSKTGPAGQMRIENYDEILVMNEEGVPDKTHDEVVGIFNKVKVDGRTRFCLVLRRKPTGKWVWIETSAVLAPESTRLPDNQPIVEKTKFQSLDNNYIESATNNRYKISGTQRYLAIRDQRVMTSVLTDTDNTDANMMCKVQRYWQDGEGRVYFQAALCDEKRRNFIGVDREKNIIVKNEPEWFDISELGSEVQFKIDDLYLGYNEQEDQVDAQPSAYLFQEIPGEVEVSQLARQTDNNSLSGTKTDERSLKRSSKSRSSSSSSDSDRKSVQSRSSVSSGKT
ncbi:uncharacterized protein LOC132757143 [Ruditapes philippinarum]|uniref:uncharacterized protein LOC132757143 n=1 Tax=Ruditapes philippinarum TaxID=129788 RepID=UPI00295B174F|nr:uncharacterized protein LOC132757143 [Ruditapes philippinarum]